MGVGECFVVRGVKWIVLDWQYSGVLDDFIVIAERVKDYDRRRLAAVHGATIRPRAVIHLQSDIDRAAAREGGPS